MGQSSGGCIMTHSFDASLKRSHAASDLPCWKQIYERAFPALVAIVDHRQDGDHQRHGIDRSLTLDNSKQILIDEKIRYRDYGDILLEYWSNREREIRGWVCKPLLCDYICYAVAPTGRAYLLPVPQLQMAWDIHGGAWCHRFKQVSALNDGYTTVSCPVPPRILFAAIGDCLRVQFDPIDDDGFSDGGSYHGEF